MPIRTSQTQKEKSLQPRLLTLVAAMPGRMQDSLQALLETMPGVVTDRAGDGAAALRMVVEQHPDLVLLDTNLPGEPGWGVLEQIKAQQPQTRCLVLAGSILQRQAAQAAGADGVLLKGFSTAELFATIEEMLATAVPGSERKGMDGVEE
jgi:DNA-binding NarL/FixJ family response regulator